MNERNKLCNMICVILSIISILLFCINLEAEQTIHFATLAPEGSTWMIKMHALDSAVQVQSEGNLRFKFYPNMTMGDEKDVIRKIRFGQLNAAGFTGVGLGEILPEIRILELPYLFKTEEEIDFVTNQLSEYFKDKLLERGFILLGWADVGWVYFLSKKPVSSPQDLTSLKVWMWEGDPLARAFFAELDQSPIPLPITDVHLSLQTGLINAVYCSPLAALALQWFTKVDYISDIPFTNAIGAVLISKSMFTRFEPELQELLLDLSKTYLRELLLQTRLDNRESYQQLVGEGLMTVPSSAAQRQLMIDIGNRVQVRLMDEEMYSQELLMHIRRLINDYRARGEEGEE